MRGTLGRDLEQLIQVFPLHDTLLPHGFSPDHLYTKFVQHAHYLCQPDLVTTTPRELEQQVQLVCKVRFDLNDEYDIRPLGLHLAPALDVVLLTIFFPTVPT
jgi:hypothetical protein